MSPQLTLGNPIHRGIFCGSSFDHPHDGPSPEISCSPLATLRFLYSSKKKKRNKKKRRILASSEEEESRGRGRNGCRPSSNLHLLLFVLPVPGATGRRPPAVREEAALQGHGHGSPEEGEQVRRELVEAVVRGGDIRGGERGGGGGRVQEAGEAQGAEHGGEGRAALQGGGARRHALLARGARPALQGRGPRPPQPRRDRRRRLTLRPRLRLAPAPRRRHRCRRRRARRLRRARRAPGRPRRGPARRRRRTLRRLRRPRRPAGVGLISSRRVLDSSSQSLITRTCTC